VSIERVKDQVVHICDRAKHELLSIVAALPITSEVVSAPAQEWMTAIQLAEYWQLYNKDGEPTTAGILKWAKRSPDEYPLPHAYMGDMMRFNRDEANQWAKEEAERRRVDNERKRLKVAG
jgi:hypothetical protein